MTSFPQLAHQTQFSIRDEYMYAQDEKLTLLPVLVLGFPPNVLRKTACTRCWYETILYRICAEKLMNCHVHTGPIGYSTFILWCMYATALPTENNVHGTGNTYRHHWKCFETSLETPSANTMALE